MTPVRLLDLTRLVSRLGRSNLTGVDRVEMAYLEALLPDPVPVFGLVRTALGYIILDSNGIKAVQARSLDPSLLGKADLVGRLSRHNSPLRARAEADLRRVAFARCLPHRLGPTLHRLFPNGVRYFNVGHSNLSARVMRAVKAMGGQVTVLIHDVIPLDYPQFTRPDVQPVFARKMAVVARHADLVIYSTQDARTRAEAHLSPAPPAIIAPLGIVSTPPGHLPPGVDHARPWFVALGTIEPRKNHALLLEVWAQLATRLPVTQMPQLYIIGARGWRNEAVFAQLDAKPAFVTECSDLDDATVAALLRGARALLFPSFAEGYGLPPLEAKSLGTAVFCSDLSVLRETMGDYPVYLDPSASYSWLETIGVASATQEKRIEQNNPQNSVPRWVDHFNIVLRRM